MIKKFKEFIKINESIELSRNELPENLYHISPYSEQIQKDWILKAASFGQGFGGGHTKGVSFFSDIEHAINYQIGMKLAVDLSKCKNGDEVIDAYKKYIFIQEKRINKDLSQMLDWVKEQLKNYTLPTLPYIETVEAVRRLVHIVSARELDQRLDDPIIIGGLERLQNLNSEDVKIIVVKTKFIDKNIEIIKGTDQNEIRVLGDVQIDKIID